MRDCNRYCVRHANTSVTIQRFANRLTNNDSSTQAQNIQKNIYRYLQTVLSTLTLYINSKEKEINTKDNMMTNINLAFEQRFYNYITNRFIIKFPKHCFSHLIRIIIIMMLVTCSFWTFISAFIIYHSYQHTTTSELLKVLFIFQSISIIHFVHFVGLVINRV